MCGRATLRQDPREIDRNLRAYMKGTWRPSYNIAPTQEQWAIIKDGDEYVLKPLRWGLIPPWADDPSIGNRMINARAETLADKPAFKGLLKTHRCLVIVDGWYEWMREGKIKRPFYFRALDDKPFTFAGLWARNVKAGPAPLETVAVITTDAPDDWKGIHHRTPVIIPPDERKRWVEGDVGDALALLHSPDPAPFDVYEVSTFVNSPKNNSPLCIKPVAA